MAYFGQLLVDNEAYLVGSTLYGVCTTAAGTSAKVVNTGILGSTFDELIEGITVNIQFVQGNTVESISLKVGSTSTLYAHGNCKCNANAVLSFTYGKVNGANRWILNAGEKTATTVMQTYDSTSSEPISGRGVAEAIAPLVPGGNSAASYSVDTEIGDNPSGAKVPTSLAVANYVNDAFAKKDALVYMGTLGATGSIIVVPSHGYSAGHVYRIVTAGTYAGYKCEVGDLILAIADAEPGQSSINSNDWTVIQTNIHNPVSGPNTATYGNVATFGASGQEIQDSGYTIQTSVPSGAVFTDTHYEDKGTVQAVTSIEEGTEFTFASITSGALNIKRGITLNKATVSIGVQEVT